MKLVRVDPQQNQPVCYVTCSGCGKEGTTREAYADLEGESFKAYYCPECVEKEQDDE